ncbi:multicopper oxidase-domain-containing protein [Xylariaceae sp. FL1272]|nr:multicopper oxidase-domain-containing protein [Xylariaceae sp. FL1272]
MRSMTKVAGLLAGLFAGLVVGAPSRVIGLDGRASTCNTPSNRACWSNGFDINTDYELSTPAGTTRTINLEITEHDNWVGPDGRTKAKAMLINNQYPGPTITADWGDTLVINVKNSLEINGTSIHWHGLRMLGTNIQDGVNGVTECPVAPGHSKTYTFRLTQYGTTWYHSHFSAQYANGVFGAIVINGPASLPYDIDLGAYPINDYYLPTADELVEQTMASPAPPASDNVLFNGTNINPVGTGGAYSKVTFTPGKRHRLRLINPSAEHNYQVSIVGHQMTVISTDLVPVNSFTTDNVFLGVGQRVDVTIDASQAVDNYWMNVTMPAANLCGSSVNTFPAAIVHYTGASNTALPNNTGTTPANPGCRDNLNYVPVVSRTTSLSTFAFNDQNTLDVTLATSPTVKWFVNSSSINVNWDKPVLDYVLTGNTSYPPSENIVSINSKNVWTFWVIENGSGVPHPMHLHGHDFLILGASANGAGAFTTAQQSSLKVNNPTRRDVTMLPAAGWLVLAFKSDNPGAWLMHCHIAWHVSGGLAVDFLERVSEQKALISAADKAAFNSNCATWQDYFDDSGVVKIDSGLKVRQIESPF